MSEYGFRMFPQFRSQEPCTVNPGSGKPLGRHFEVEPFSIVFLCTWGSSTANCSRFAQNGYGSCRAEVLSKISFSLEMDL